MKTKETSRRGAEHAEKNVFLFSASPAPLRATILSRAFTLVELLVVVAVLSALLAILLPSLASARRIAKRTACQSNLRQLAIEWEYYLRDHDGRFLKGIETDINYGGKQGTRNMPPLYPPVPKPLNTYLELPLLADEAKVFGCPADSGGGPGRDSHYDRYGTSYICDPTLIGQTQLSRISGDPCDDLIREINKRIADLTVQWVTSDPARLILLGDFGWAYVWSDLASRADWHAARDTHNIAFLDGHASFTKIYKGVHVTNRYTIVPFNDLLAMAAACQPPTP